MSADTSHSYAATPSGGLALALQEALTATVRLRANRQVAADADSFRAHMKSLLASADQEARSQGYDAGDVRLAVYAVVAFLDESVLHSSQAMFSDWPRQPLQEEIFGDHMAGETFYQHLRTLMGRQDSPDLADVLEVFDLCLLLGFHGRYRSETSEVQRLRSGIRERIQRIRGFEPLAPSAPLPPDEVAPDSRDPWIRRLGILAVGGLIVCVLLLVVYSLLLRGEVAELRNAADPLVSAVDAQR